MQILDISDPLLDDHLLFLLILVIHLHCEVLFNKLLLRLYPILLPCDQVMGLLWAKMRLVINSISTILQFLFVFRRFYLLLYELKVVNIVFKTKLLRMVCKKFFLEDCHLKLVFFELLHRFYLVALLGKSLLSLLVDFAYLFSGSFLLSMIINFIRAIRS